MIFVFDSNLKGVESKGNAQIAREHFGADPKVVTGRSGNSYAIPTKDKHLATLNVDRIMPYVEEFKEYAKANPDTTFIVTKIGTGLLGHYDQAIATLFKGAPRNCSFHFTWKPFLTTENDPFKGDYNYYSKIA